MNSAFQKKLACKNSEISELLYYSNNFLSFSKKEDEANKFLEKGDINTTPVKFIINEVKDKDFFISNIEISQYSEYKTEDEVLVLPLSCFTIENICDEIINNIPVKIINLQMLGNYKNKIDNYMKTINQEELQVFYEKSLKSDFGKTLYNSLGKEIHDKFQKEIEKETNVTLENIDIEPPPPKPPSPPPSPPSSSPILGNYISLPLSYSNMRMMSHI